MALCRRTACKYSASTLRIQPVWLQMYVPIFRCKATLRYFTIAFQHFTARTGLLPRGINGIRARRKWLVRRARAVWGPRASASPSPLPSSPSPSILPSIAHRPSLIAHRPLPIAHSPSLSPLAHVFDVGTLSLPVLTYKMEWAASKVAISHKAWRCALRR